jgi:fatty acid desaturase
MDVWASVLRRLGIPSLNFALLGRWIGHMPRGTWRHVSITKAAPIRGEAVIGWTAHYSIGVTFAALLLATFGLGWARSPSFGPALFIGIVSVLAPLVILQPAFGAGIASTRTPRPIFNSVKSFVTHVVYGSGLYLAALATAGVIPAGR